MVKKLWTADGVAEIGGNGYKTDGEVIVGSDTTAAAVEKLLTVGVVCSEAEIIPNTVLKNEWNILGSPTEGSLLIAAKKFGIDINRKRSGYRVEEVIPFTSEQKKMTVIVENVSDDGFDKNKRYVFCKGAPNIILENCAFIFKDGAAKAITGEEKTEILKINDGYAADGFRILALCFKEKDDGPADKDLCLIGLSVVYDPPRLEVAHAVEQCKRAGIKITVITGDYGLTAAAIARQVEIIKDDYVSVNGVEVEAMPQKELMALLSTDKPVVFSRTTPQHKLKIVEAYKKLGEIVAVTGDGVNDILALRSAHIGIAMGKSGTDVARDAADMILLDDNFSTIVRAVEEGRGIYANIKKFMTYILASNVAEMVPVIAMGLFGIPPALTVLQILAIDLGTDLLPALALGAERPEKGLLNQPPRKKTEALLDKKLLLRAYGFLGVIEAAVSMGLFLLSFALNGIGVGELVGLKDAIVNATASGEVLRIYAHATTMTLMGVIFCQIGNVFACRSETRPFYKSFASENKWIYIGILAELAIALALVYVPFMQTIFDTAPLKGTDFLFLLACPIILLAFEEFRKLIVRKRKARI